MAQAGGFALDGGDPRLMHDDAKGPAGAASMSYTALQQRKLHDNSITFEEYNYFAEKTRSYEDSDPPPARNGILSVIFPRKSGSKSSATTTTTVHPEKTERTYSNPNARIQVADEEWINASRALRTATTSAIFYLITTDILGPFGLPYAFASMGWG